MSLLSSPLLSLFLSKIDSLFILIFCSIRMRIESSNAQFQSSTMVSALGSLGVFVVLFHRLSTIASRAKHFHPYQRRGGEIIQAFSWFLRSIGYSTAIRWLFARVPSGNYAPLAFFIGRFNYRFVSSFPYLFWWLFVCFAFRFPPFNWTLSGIWLDRKFEMEPHAFLVWLFFYAFLLCSPVTAAIGGNLLVGSLAFGFLAGSILKRTWFAWVCLNWPRSCSICWNLIIHAFLG